MRGSDMREIRRQLRMDRLQFARLLGYTGTDRNDAMRVRRHENSPQVPLYLARLAWLISVWVKRTNELPPFPGWVGYDFDHTPDEE
jgi:hypothetical protein